MKKKILYLAALPLLLWRCGKDDTTQINTCTVQEQRSHPGNDSARLFIPNAFTPNGDGLNDFFGPLTTGISSIDFSVYDAGNNLVFHTEQPGQYWSAPGTGGAVKYTYQVKATTTANDQLSWCGSVYALACMPSYIKFDELIFADQFEPTLPENTLLHSQESYVPCN